MRKLVTTRSRLRISDGAGGKPIREIRRPNHGGFSGSDPVGGFCRWLRRDEIGQMASRGSDPKPLARPVKTGNRARPREAFGPAKPSRDGDNPGKGESRTLTTDARDEPH